MHFFDYMMCAKHRLEALTVRRQTLQTMQLVQSMKPPPPFFNVRYHMPSQTSQGTFFFAI